MGSYSFFLRNLKTAIAHDGTVDKRVSNSALSFEGPTK